MAAMFPSTWARQNGMVPFAKDGSLTRAGDLWAKVLAGRRRSQHARGLACCLTEGREWPPNPARFLTMCLDVPVLATVERELAPGCPQSGFTVLVRSLLDLHLYATADDGFQQRRMLQEAYDRAVRHVVEGGLVPEPALALPPVQPGAVAVRDRPAAAEAMARAAAELGFGSAA